MGKGLYWCGCLYSHDSLAPPVNLWTTGTVGQLFVLSVHYVKFVSGSESNSNISSVTSRFVRFLLVAVLQIAFWPKSAHTKPITFWLIMIQASALPGLSHIIVLIWNGVKSWVEDRHKHEPTFQESGRNPYTKMKAICLSSRIALNIEINICMHYFPLPLIAYELIPHSTQISQLYHDTHTSLWDWNVHNVSRNMMTCTHSSKFYSTGSPLTIGATGK